MIVYGIYGVLLVSGLLVLLIVAQGRLSEASAKHQSQLVLPYFVLATVLFLSLLTTFPRLYGRFPVLVFLFGTVVVGLVILTVFLVIKAELDRGRAGRERAEASIEKHIETLKNNPDDFGSHAGLARAYEKTERYELAAGEYERAAGLCSEDARRYAHKLDQMAETMKKLSAREEVRRSIPCPGCGQRNRPLERLCSECGAQLYGNTLRWAWMNTSLATKIAALAVVILSSLFFLKLPFTYGLTLMGVWLALIFYFSLPWEKFTHI